MAGGKRDLVVHYDEARQEIVFYSTDSSKTEAIRAAEFGGCRIRVSHLKEKSPSDAEQTVGGTVLAILDQAATAKTGIRDYAAEAEKAAVEHRAMLERQVQVGDVEASYHLAIELHYSAIKHGSAADLERAGALFDAAARAGHPDGIRATENWPDMRDSALRLIQRRNRG
ncbi:hypothetical protein [Paraburkholderia dinghuensis]|uniref:Uncharacterized protein n=1 Tax=Paraburkholderia dinghuensis TaxID=2305225 RepID=A0A3N6MPJ8_9BURK|nr:hypothetical protein [Paraburkholderia dinghuensis]RQH05649.1 hypothetical protein D1Y85_13515 [Paraburkholderia dinghuensis]